ncbi:MAG: glycosyltransferase family 4 protein [Candidatus Hodarchaeota archaeon]
MTVSEPDMHRCRDSSIKILHVDVNGWVYGVQKYVINFCRELNKVHGYRAIVVGPSGQYLNKLKKENITVISLNKRWKKIDKDPKAWVKLYQIIRKEKPDIIHSHGTKENIICKIIGKSLNIPVVPVYHCIYKLTGSGDMLIGLKRKLYEGIFLDILENVTAFFTVKNIAVSNSINSNIMGFGIPKEKIEVIPPGIEINGIKVKKHGSNINNRRIRITSISRIEIEKGILDIIEAGKILRGKNQSFEMIIVGGGSFLRECGEIVHKNGLDAEIKFLGYRENVSEILLESDIFVSASHSEGFGLNVIEAMSMGIPVIVSNAGALTEIVEESKSGFIYERKNPNQLADKLLVLMRNADLRIKYGRKARERVHNQFSNERMMSKMLRIYEELL